jgi:hypothetical protein
MLHQTGESVRHSSGFISSVEGIRLLSQRFYDEDPWPDLKPHTLNGIVERIEIQNPDLTGPFHAVLTIRISEIDSGTFPVLRKLSGGIGFLDKPAATVLLYYDPAD